MSRAREVLRFYRQYTSSLPDELTAYASLLTTLAGEPAIAITLCFCGVHDVGKLLIEPVRKFGSPLVDRIRPQSYLKLITQERRMGATTTSKPRRSRNSRMRRSRSSQNMAQPAPHPVHRY